MFGDDYKKTLVVKLYLDIITILWNTVAEAQSLRCDYSRSPRRSSELYTLRAPKIAGPYVVLR